MDKPIDKDYALQPELCRKVEETLTTLFQRYRTTRDVTPEQLHITVQSLYSATYGLLDDDISQLLSSAVATALEELDTPSVTTLPVVMGDTLATTDPHSLLAVVVRGDDIIITSIQGERNIKIVTCDSHMDACHRAMKFIDTNLTDWEKIC